MNFKKERRAAALWFNERDWGMVNGKFVTCARQGIATS